MYMWKKVIRTTPFILFFVFFFQTAHAVDAPDLGAQVMGQIDSAVVKAEVGAPVDPREAVAGIIKVFLSLIGTIFFVLLIMSGYWLITARGEEEKETKAKNTIRSAVIGLAIVIAAYGITVFVTKGVERATGPAMGPAQCPTAWWNFFSRSSCVNPP